MGQWPDPTAGQPVANYLSAARHRAVNALLHATESANANQDKIKQTRSFVCLSIKNTTDTDVPRGGVLGLDGPIFDADDNENGLAGNSIKWKGVKPNSGEHGDRFAIVTNLVPQGKVRSHAAVVAGWAPARVDINNTDHRFAKIIEDDVTKLESSTSGIPMVPAQTGTGEKWAVVLLGGGASISVLIGKVSATGGVSDSDSTFSIDGVTVISGTDPRDNDSPGETVTIQNTLYQEYDDDELVIAYQYEAGGEWHTDKVSNRQNPAALRYFELIEPMAYSDTAKQARPVLANGLLDTSGDPVWLLNTNLRFWGLSSYAAFGPTSPVSGYRFWAQRETVDYNDTGKPGYGIVAGDSPAPEIIVRITDAAASQSVLPTFEWVSSKSDGWSGMRRPKNLGAAGLDLADPHEMIRDNHADGDLYEASWSVDLGKYIVSGRFQEGQYLVVRGQASAVLTGSETHFTLQNLTAIQGEIPLDPDDNFEPFEELTVINKPAVCTETVSEFLYAVFDLSVGTDATAFDDDWTTGHAGNLRNFIQHPKATAQELIYEDADGEVTLGETVNGFIDRDPINRSGFPVWDDATVTLSANGKKILASNSARLVTASVTSDSPTDLGSFNSWNAASHGHYTHPSGGQFVDAMGQASKLKMGDKVMFSIRQTGSNQLTYYLMTDTGGGDLLLLELTQDMAYTDSAKLGKPIQADGTLDTAADAVYLVQPAAHAASKNRFFGHPSYTSITGSTEHGYRFWCQPLTDNYSGGVPGYAIISGDGPAPMLVVTQEGTWSQTDGGYAVEGNKAVGAGWAAGRLPKQYSAGGTDILADDPEKLAEKAGNTDKFLAAWFPADAKYKLISAMAAKANEIGLVTITISKSAVNGSAKTITPGIVAGAVQPMKWNSTPDALSANGAALAGINLSLTDLRASVAEPIAVVGFRATVYVDAAETAGFVVTSLMDFRALPGFVVGDAPSAAADDDADMQIPFHAGGSRDFQLDSEECDGS